VLVPDGWTATKIELGIDLTNDKSASASVLVQGKTAELTLILTKIRNGLEHQLRGFEWLGSGRVPFGGLNGAYGAYSGLSNTDTKVVGRVVVMTHDQHTYSLITTVPAETYGQSKDDMERIEASFSVVSTSLR